MSLLLTTGAFIVALAVLIIIHEFGHFLVARSCGVRVLRFSIGFGRPIWMRRVGADRTEWAIAAVPLGGYVKMLDEREGPVDRDELPRAFNRQNVWRRMAIVAAGPIANFLLAVALYWFLFVSGVVEIRPILGAPESGSLAARSGIQRGETVASVNGESIASWQDLRWRILRSAVERQTVRLEVIDVRGHLSWRTLDLASFSTEGLETGDPLARIGLRLHRPDIPPVIGRVLPGGAAELAGLRAGDHVVAIDDRPIGSWEDLVGAVRSRPGTPLRMTLDRGTVRLAVEVVPEAVEQRGERFGRIGAAPQLDGNAARQMTILIRYGPLQAVQMALVRTWETSIFSLRMLGKMLIGELSWRNLSGPVTIADYAGQSAQTGLSAYLAFIALISISLGVLNLLPIPLLDGGHLMYYAVEVMKGSPVSERAIEVGQKFGLTILLSLMAFAFYNDINRLLSG